MPTSSSSPSPCSALIRVAVVVFMTTSSFAYKTNPTFVHSPTVRLPKQAADREPEAKSSAVSKQDAAATMATIGSSFLALSLVFAGSPAGAVSGGGLDYANLDITGQDFSNGNYKGKDFTQIIAKGTTFANSNLQGCRFYKAFLVNTDFSGADLRGASLEDTSMDGANLDGANAVGAYFSASLLDSESITGADFTDAQLPPKLLPRICEREGFATGSNPKTGIDTRDSLMCP